MARFLLDANLSPRTARYLSLSLGLDVVALLSLGLGEIDDHEVIQIATEQGRTVITLDADFLAPWVRRRTTSVGVIYLDLPNGHRDVRSVNARMRAAFEEHPWLAEFSSGVAVISLNKVLRVTDGSIE